jgi:hypothetical protein
MEILGAFKRDNYSCEHHSLGSTMSELFEVWNQPGFATFGLPKQKDLETGQMYPRESSFRIGNPRNICPGMIALLDVFLLSMSIRERSNNDG